MDSRARARRRAEKKYVHRTVLVSAIIAAFLFAGICLFAAMYPTLQARRVARYINAGEYARAQAAIAQLKDRDAASGLEKDMRMAMARDQMRAGQYEAAREAFLALGEYENAPEMARESAWRWSDALFTAGDYEGAQRVNLLIPDYPGVAQRNLEIRYIQATAALESDKAAAFDLFQELGDYRDAVQIAGSLAVELTGISNEAEAITAMNTMSPEDIALYAARERMRPGAVRAGGLHSVGLRADGTVLAAGRNAEGQCEVSGWSGVVQIGAGVLHTVALLGDGTVVATGSNAEGQCDVSAWRDVVEIACGDYATFARFADGTVAATGYPKYVDIEAWRGVTKLSAGAYMAAGLYGAGSAYATHPSAQAERFTGLADLALTTGGAVGLGTNGEVSATFDGFPAWRNIVQISAGNHGVLGIDADGKVFAHFFRYTDAFAVDAFTDAVCVSAGDAHCLILDADGHVSAFGNNDFGQCDVEDWDLN